MTASILENYFDRSKKFYPYIMQYIITYHGAVELTSRGMVKEVTKLFSIYGREKVIESLNINDKASDFIKKDQNLTPLLGNLSLKSNYMKRNIEIDIQGIADEVVNNHDIILKYMTKAAGILIIMCFEETKQLDDRSELWNFFYHCRNAAAHGGRFRIKNPRFPAIWGDLEINPSLDGTNLFYIPDEGGLLAVGDPIRLLWEIEQKYL